MKRADGVLLTVRLLLPKKPIRQAQKLKTLTQYVQRHPSGWKKRLALAELRYEMGHWEEAILDFRWVLARQPNLPQGLSVRLKLAKMLEILERPAEAMPVYQAALNRITYEPSRQYLQQAMESCQKNVDVAANDDNPHREEI
ncbi:tetratricopeptide repeat protein [Leptolyngbyaceae cyanobacterium CCMR0082]|uniref:Tetratricopeptide repeat protein n=1 Tax=Adonisia turfae CCMR0082 TaxID=2304604 RepID=A0A6M0S3R5_9CYAN|nr:tetratricopeptide repeat protein [Adonisia turfae]MDV3347810.1 tetratricopeptide repeat protein [Leptothoe sp. LEGE 181152]NEZ62683.1 tetratricopeptide repeat protein [Adonisia turfae CCMR0082]